MTESELFDRMSLNYDQEVAECDAKNEFPFAGYGRVLDFIASEIAHDSHLGKVRILDLGIGTGSLEAKMNPEKFDLTALDLSEKMLEVAQMKLPNARYFLHDFRLGFPEDLKNDKFDLIVSTYAMHHLDFDEWIEYVHFLSQHLTVFGKIFIGDILFMTPQEKAICKNEHAREWDEDGHDHYHVYEEILARVCDHLAVSFLKVSYCAGVIILENYHECREYFGKKAETTLKFGK